MNFFTSTESEQTAGLYFSNYHETSKHRYPEKSGEKKKKKKISPNRTLHSQSRNCNLKNSSLSSQLTMQDPTHARIPLIVVNDGKLLIEDRER